MRPTAGVKVNGDTPFTVQIEAVKVKDAARSELLTMQLEPVRRSLVVARALTKSEARAEAARQAIRSYLEPDPRSATNAIEDVGNMRRGDVREALVGMVDRGEVDVSEGRRAARYSIPSP